MMLAPPHFHLPAQHAVSGAMEHQQQAPVLAIANNPPRSLRKRKAEDKPENNERLSKRMSLLNIEQSGPKLYVPVESHHPNLPLSPTQYAVPKQQPQNAASPDDNNMMALDDTKYKVYIRNLEDELSDSDESVPEDTNNNLIFLPDIEKHLRDNRIPPAVLRGGAARPADLDKQLVLYRVPSSLTVPEEQDSVRKAILEARARLRRGGRAEPSEVDMDADEEASVGRPSSGVVVGEDPDAMELD